MIEEPPGEPTASSKLPLGLSTMAGAIDERGRLPGATALAAAVPSVCWGEKEKSVSWLLRKKPSTIRPLPNRLSTVVVIETTLPARSTITMWVVPPGSLVASAPTLGASLGTP
jgi:hypothetical protein